MDRLDCTFTSLYGLLGPPSLLRGCFAGCEAMGWVPVFNPEHIADKEGVFPTVAMPDKHHFAWEVAHSAAGAHECSGWHAVKCQSCNGTGRVSWWRTIARFPLWTVRALKAIPELARAEIHGPNTTRREAYWLSFKVCVLVDLGLWRP